MIIELKTIDDLPFAAKIFLEETDNRKIFAFEGQMGVGKTTFIVSLLKAMGIEEMLYGGDYCFIEWPQKIENLLPENTIWVRIRNNEQNERTISIEMI
jgi:tRNA threonylcarbamoyladenosine biosynthesis protein TsaE